MTSLADRVYFEDAVKALEECHTETQLVNWDDRFTSNEAYIHLPDDLAAKLEAAYRRRVAHVLGGLA